MNPNTSNQQNTPTTHQPTNIKYKPLTVYQKRSYHNLLLTKTKPFYQHQQISIQVKQGALHQDGGPPKIRKNTHRTHKHPERTNSRPDRRKPQLPYHTHPEGSIPP